MCVLSEIPFRTEWVRRARRHLYFSLKSDTPHRKWEFPSRWAIKTDWHLIPRCWHLKPIQMPLQRHVAEYMSFKRHSCTPRENTMRNNQIIQTTNIKESQPSEDETEAFNKILQNDDNDRLNRIIPAAPHSHTNADGSRMWEEKVCNFTIL